ncbi:unnamed protein product, partial [Musa acuminata var. zebrina]
RSPNDECPRHSCSVFLMCRAIPSSPRKLSSMAGSHGPDKAAPPSRHGGCIEARAVAPVEALGTLVIRIRQKHGHKDQWPWNMK